MTLDELARWHCDLERRLGEHLSGRTHRGPGKLRDLLQAALNDPATINLRTEIHLVDVLGVAEAGSEQAWESALRRVPSWRTFGLQP